MKHARVEANGLSFALSTAGDAGPLVVLCHGFPELAYSWRHQLPALAAAGFRAVAPDMRGYGGTRGPNSVDRYSVFELVGDIVAIVQALGEREAIIVGHDWGAAVAWQAALIRPDMFKAVCAMSVPFQPRRPGKLPIDSYRKITAEKGLGEFYIVAFQDEGRVEAEFEVDVERTMRAVFGGIAEEGREADRWSLYAKPGEPLLQLHNPRPLPAWISEREFAVFVDAFRANGFRRPIHWYRNIDRNWLLSAPWQDASIGVPALFITGSRDPVRGFAGAAERALAEFVPDLRGSVVIEGAGHWVQQEAAAEVNEALLGFLKGL
nr:alpha/beta hydrolase [Chelatococcus reniformis]